MLFRYEIKSGRRRAWDIAVVSAEDAFSMTVQKRRREYTFTYYLNGSKPGTKPDSKQEDVLPNGAIQRKRKHEKEQVCSGSSVQGSKNVKLVPRV